MMLFSPFLFVAQFLFTSSANQLRHSQANKWFIDQLKEGSYEIIHPFQVREKSRERMGIDTREHFLNATPAQHFRQASFVLRSSVLAHQRLRLTLALNEHLLAAKSRLRSEHRPEEGQKQEEAMEEEIENCFYQGSVHGEPGSQVALSTCDGLWGLLAFPNGTALGIWPLEGGDRGRRHPHVLFRVANEAGGKCGTMPALERGEEGHHRRRRKRGEIGGQKGRPKLFLEMALIADLDMMRHFNLSRPKSLEFALNALNLADLLFRRLNLRLAASLVELLPTNLAGGGDDGQQMLGALLDHATGRLYGEEKDATILMSGQRMANGERMAALPGTVCTSRAIGVVQVPSPFSPHHAALALAHSVGHIIGLDHDSAEDCGCGEGQQCVMAPHFGSPSATFPVHFSACSFARLRALIDHPEPAPHLQCLLTRPFHPSARLFLCGNGVLDAGEECDCGRREQCQDACCEPHTCQLRPHAQCAGHQECCHRCQPRPAGHPCRPARSVCDVPEHCDGIGGECPMDGHLLDGTQCGMGGAGQCWQGRCADGDGQCRELWGQGAKLGDPLCFRQNGRALEYGNCGRDADGRFVECAPENERCGLLQCREGPATPALANATSFAMQFSQGARLVQCKVVTSNNSPPPLPPLPMGGLVQDGTSCGPGRVCISSVCLPLAQVSPPVQCPSNNMALQCSGHGDCTSTRQCLCFDGWTGPACDVRSPHRRTESSRGLSELISSLPPSTRFGSAGGKALMETATLLAILLLVGLLLLLLLICLLLFYRRKSSSDPFRRRIEGQMKGGGGGGPAADEEDDGETPGRAIKFGQMPSWREEKRKRKTNKRVYDALQRITEANEADSLSLKSRESSVATGAIGAGPTSAQQQQFMLPAGDNFVGHHQQQPNANVHHHQFFHHSSPPPNHRHIPPTALAASSPRFFTTNGGGGIYQQQREDGGGGGLVLLGKMASELNDGEEEAEEGLPPPQAPHFGPRLANISLLMRTLDETIGGRGEDEFGDCGGGQSAARIQPPASADSGNPGSDEVRESPSLFSDPYRLDLPS